MLTTVDNFEIYYSDYSDSKTCELRGLVDKNTEGSLIIPKEIDGRTVTSISWFKGYPNITELVMPDTVENVRCIRDCDSLKKIVFSKKINEISSCGFLKNLEEIVIPEGVKTIGYNAFWYCKKLKSVNIPNSVEVIGGNAFSECPLITEVTLPDNLKVLDGTSFMWDKIKTYDEGNASYLGPKSNPHWVFVSWKDKNSIPSIADDVKIIGTDVYKNNLAVESLKLPNTIEGISSDCFYGARNLKVVEIPSSIKEIPYQAFHSSHVEKVILNEGIKTIDACAFWNIVELKSIEIPSSVTMIAQQAFEGCIGLEEVILNEGLTSIGHYCFQKCRNLKEITLPASLKSLPTSSFFATGLTKATFKGTNVTFIDSSVFKDCVNLTTIVSDTGDEEGVIHLPSSIAKINNEAFSGCKSIKKIDLTKNLMLDGVKERAFAFCDSLESVGWAPFVKEMQKELFLNCSNIKELTFSKAVRNIDVSVFDGAKINKVYFDGALTEWAQIPRTELIFKDNFDLYIQGEQLKELVVGDDEVSIVEPYAFANVNLDSIEIRPNLTKLGDGAFYGVGNLDSLTADCGEDDNENPFGNAFVWEGGSKKVFADVITIMGSDAVISADTFKAFKGAKIVKFGKSVKKIEKGALMPLADTVEEVYLPFLGETISDTRNNYLGYVFGLDTYDDHSTKMPAKLKKVQVYNAKEIGKGAFYDVKLDKLILPIDVAMIDSFAFSRIDIENIHRYNGGHYVPLGANECAVLIKVDTDEKSFAVAPECKFIISYAFKNLPKLKEITIPETVVKIEPRAVEDCKKLGKVNLLNPIGWNLYNYLSNEKEPYSQKDASNVKRVAKDLKYGDGLIKLDVERKY